MKPTPEQIKKMAEEKALEVYPIPDEEESYYTTKRRDNQLRREGHIKCFIDNYKESDAVEFLEWITTMEVDRVSSTAGWEVGKLNDGIFTPILTSEKLYELFKQSKLK